VARNSLLILLIILLASSAWATTPSITTVTGTVSQDQTLTITGTTMVDENTTNWIKNDDNAGTVYDQTYFTGSTNPVSGDYGWTTLADGSNTIAYDSTVKVVGTQSVKMVNNTACQETTSCGQVCLYETTAAGLPSDFYVSTYAMFNGTWAYYYQKFFLTVGAVDEFYIQPQPVGDGTVSGWEFKDNNWQTTGGTSSDFTLNKWHFFEARIQSTGYSGDRFTLWWDGVQVLQWTATGHSGAVAQYNEIGIPNWAGLNGTPNVVPFTVWVNRYVFSTSRIYEASLIEIGDSAIYASATKVRQIPTYLSDTSSIITANLTGLGPAPYYLFVTNNKQEVSAGYNLSGADETPPTLSSVAIGTNGTTWTFAFDETISIGAGGNGGWAVSMSTQGAVTLTYSSGSGTSSLVYTGNKTVLSGETVSSGLNYTQPGSGITDTATIPNDLANISSHAVTNNSIQAVVSSVMPWGK
jgi:hypothetical protein